MDNKEKAETIGVALGFLIFFGSFLTIAGLFVYDIAFSDPFEAPPCPGYGEPNFVHSLWGGNHKDSHEDIMNRLERAGWQNVTLHESGRYITAYCVQEMGGNNDDE